MLLKQGAVSGNEHEERENEKWEQKKLEMKDSRSNLVLFPFFIFRVPQCSFPVLVTFKLNTQNLKSTFNRAFWFFGFVLFCFCFVFLEPIFMLYLPEQPLP